MVDTIEALNRGWHIEGQSVSPTTAWCPHWVPDQPARLLS
jgi:hypothetical protein